MKNSKVILLAELLIQPEFSDEVKEAARESVESALKYEHGVLSMTLTCHPDQPNSLVFFEVYASQEAFNSHQKTEHAKHFFATTEGKRMQPSKLTFLSEF